MTSCWKGQPELRPTFHEVLKTIQQSFKVDTTNQATNEIKLEENTQDIETTPLLSSSDRVPSYNSIVNLV
jgi:hypothetical protein